MDHGSPLVTVARYLNCLSRYIECLTGEGARKNTCWLLTPQVPSEVCETSEGYLYRIHDLLTRCVHLQVLLTRCGHRIIDLGVSRTSSEEKDNTAIMLKIFAFCTYLFMYVFI